MILFRFITPLTGPVGYTSFRWPLRAMAKYTHKTGIYATGTLFFLSGPQPYLTTVTFRSARIWYSLIVSAWNNIFAWAFRSI